MVSASACLRSPVVSLFSASPSSSRLAQEVLRDLFSMEPITLRQEEHDDLDKVVNIPMLSRRWDSVASKCPSSGAVLHFLSLTSSGANTDDNQAAGHISLLGITDSDNEKRDDSSAVQESRRLLASHIRSHKNPHSRFLRLVLKHAAGRSISTTDVLGFEADLPFLNLPMNSDVETQPQKNVKGGLKEIAIPFYDDSVYPDGQSLLSVLGASALKRPAVGLYQWPENGIAVRPLPSAMEDRTLPVPSLVFYCEDLDEASEKVANHTGAISAKIGFNGLGKSGQLMVSHPSLLGMDIRLTDSKDFTSAFPESQEALLASSLGELQNVNVVLEGGKADIAARSKMDERTNEADCWVEFRANMKRPSGFLKRTIKNGGKTRTAKAPDLPYE